MKLPKFYDGRSKEEKDRDAYYNGRFLLWAVCLLLLCGDAICSALNNAPT